MPAMSMAAAKDEVASTGTADTFSHATFDSLLRLVVHEDRVDYGAAKKNRTLLNRYLVQIAEAQFPRGASHSDSLAFFINAYNAVTLGFVLDRYPAIKSVLEEEDGAFFKRKARVAGRELSLDEIEHEILRKRFQEPRIHFAINCASISCPPLLGTVFTAEGLEEQLDGVTRSYLNDPRHNRLDPATGTLFLSQLFEWFGEDFVRAFGSVQAFVLSHIESTGGGPDETEIKISYLPYDWRLNDWKP
jgi:hypothetical protein